MAYLILYFHHKSIVCIIVVTTHGGSHEILPIAIGFVCLFVCLLATLLNKLLVHYDEIFRMALQ